jgi:hypothetical protein
MSSSKYVQEAVRNVELQLEKNYGGQKLKKEPQHLGQLDMYLNLIQHQSWTLAKPSITNHLLVCCIGCVSWAEWTY